MRKLFHILTLLTICISSYGFAQEKDKGKTSNVDVNHVREYAILYLADEQHETYLNEPISSLVERCIAKFNSKQGLIDETDILLIDGGIIDSYKTYYKVNNLYPLLPIDLAMMRFAFGGIERRGIKLPRSSLVMESVERIKWDGVRMEHAYFYFDEGFIKLLMERMEFLRNNGNGKNKEKLESLEIEFITMMLSLWDMDLSEEHKNELIKLTMVTPQSIKDDILISQIIRILPRGKYPRDVKALTEIAIDYILNDDVTKTPSEQKMITRFLVAKGFLHSIYYDTNSDYISESDASSKKSMLSLLSDKVDLSYFQDPDNQADWLVYYELHNKIERDYKELKETKIIKTLQEMYGSQNSDVSVVLELFAKDVAQTYPELTKEQTELIFDENFYSSIKKYISLMGDDSAKTDSEIILFYLALIAKSAEYNEKMPLRRACSLETSNIISEYIQVFTIRSVCDRVEERKIGTRSTSEIIIKTLSTFMEQNNRIRPKEIK